MSFKRREIVSILLLSGFFGFCLGLLNARYQAVIDYAQVLAGVVEYPHSNPFYIASIKAWSLLTQICVVLLRLGFSDKVLSFLFSGLAGMISFQALAVSVLVLSRNKIFALLSPFFIFFIHGTWLDGVNYPVSLMGTDGTFGMIGLSFLLLVIALISIGRYGLGGLLLGISPAIHPTQGLWCNLIVVICILWDFSYHRGQLKRLIKYVFLGYLITAGSLVYQLSIARDLPKISSAILYEYKYALITYWSEHLDKISIFSGGMVRAMLGLILPLWALRFFKNIVPQEAVFLLRSFVAAFLIAAALSFVYWLPSEILINKFYSLIMIQPARLFNYNLLGSMVILLGSLCLLSGFKDNRQSYLNLTIFMIILTFSRFIINDNYHLANDSLSIGAMFLSSLALITSTSPLRDSKKNVSKQRRAWLTLNLSCFLMTAFLCSAPFLGGISREAFIAIMVLSIGILLSSRFFSMNAGKSTFRGLFMVEGVFFLICGSLWLLKKSENPVLFDRYSLIKLMSVSYLYFIGILILLFSRFGFLLAIVSTAGNFLKRVSEKIALNAAKVVTVSILGLSIVLTVIMSFYNFKENASSHFRDWTNDALYKKLYEGEGLVLAGPRTYAWINVRARRPVLYYGTPQLLIYALESGPELNRIFKGAYGVDFLNPPHEALVTGRNIPADFVRGVWESRGLRQWRKVGREFRVKDVVAVSDWKIRLPEISRNDRFVLYSIP